MRNFKEISYSPSGLNRNRLFAVLLTMGGVAVLLTAPATLFANWSNVLLPVVVCLGIMAVPYIYALVHCSVQWSRQAQMKEFLDVMRAAAKEVVDASGHQVALGKNRLGASMENHMGAHLHVLLDHGKPGVYEFMLVPFKESAEGIRHFALDQYSLTDTTNRYRPVSLKLATAMISLMQGHMADLIDDTDDTKSTAIAEETELDALLSGHGIEG